MRNRKKRRNEYVYLTITRPRCRPKMRPKGLKAKSMIYDEKKRKYDEEIVMGQI